MSAISSGVGLISGINYQSLITALVAVDAEPEQVVETEITNAQDEEQAFSGLTTDLNGLQTIGNQLALPETFQAATTSSSDPDTLTATAAEGAAVGSYQFQVAQLVTTQQSISQGFANATSAPVGAGTLTLEEGGGEASSQTLLSQLNGGQGVQSGEFRITDGSGQSAVINTSDAVTLDDVVNDINSAGNISVKASLTDTGIVLTDTSGGSGQLQVQDLSGGTAAQSLGIAGSGTGSIIGSAINYIGNDTPLSSLNDGRGVNAGDANALTYSTPISELNDGNGISTASGTTDFKVTLSSGKTFSVSVGAAQDLSDVIADINSAGGTSISAQISTSGQGLELTDNSGGTGTFSVTAVNGSQAAADLGILGSSTDGVITGSAISTPDFQVTLASGASYDVSLGSAQTVGDLLSAINTDTDGNATASIAANGQSIQIVDNTSGTGTFGISNVNGSTAATDLGIAISGTGGILQGSTLQAGLDSVLISSLNGGQGFQFGYFNVTNHAGTSGSIDLSKATSLSDVLSDINNSGLDLTASLNSAGTGIQITDNSTGTGSLVISNGGGGSQTATDLGIAGTYSGSTAVGSNLHTQYVSLSTPLSQLNGGQGVQDGEFTITNSKSDIFTVNLNSGTYNTVGDVIKAINNLNAGVTASINSTGSGILLTDTAGGTGELTVNDIDGGTAATDLNIAGTASGTGANNTIDGAFEKTINVTATDTLTTLQAKINALGFGVTAQIINDGSSSDPYRLSLTSVNSGVAGQVVIDGGTTNLNPSTLVKAQNAAVFLGGTDGEQPLLITSATNQITNVIKGVTVSLLSASSTPVTLNVTADPSGVETSLSNFVTQFNALTSQIGTYTAFNTNTNQGGLLLGDETTQQIQQVMFNALNASVNGNGDYNNLASIGITIGANAQISFNQTQFEQAFASDPQAVQNLFSQTTTGLGNVISNAVDSLTDPVNGLVTEQENTLSTKVQNYQTYYNELAQTVVQKQSQLENQFANLEDTLAQLQSQQQVLGTLSDSSSTDSSSASTTPAASTSSSSSDSGSSSSS
jgi:flagellar hook-associated protein 2